MITLALYLTATALTGLTTEAWMFFVLRFLTGAGIGGEYAAINSAIDELIPADYRGRINIIINGTFWIGAAGGALLSIVALNEDFFPKDIGWRLTFFLGLVFGLVILLVRRTVPESPRWLFIHGREDEAEKIVRSIEEKVQRDTGEPLPEVGETITIHQRPAIGFGLIAKTLFGTYPRRAVLGFSLFIGQAFIYNAVTLTACWCATLFFASAGASSAYLTVSEVFPMETRAMAIAFFYAIGTATGGITGPLVFANMVATGQPLDTAIAFSIGAILMLVAGVIAIFLSIDAEKQSLEDIAAPLSSTAPTPGTKEAV